MTIEQIFENESLTLALHGRLDTSTAPQLHEVLMAGFEKAKEIVLDFSNVEYVSSAGLRVLLIGQKTSKAKNISMCVRNVSEEIMEVFDMTGFTDILSFA